jgi:hypothetical protein
VELQAAFSVSRPVRGTMLSPALLALTRLRAFGVDSIDFDLVRSVFHPGCVCVGTAEADQLDEYLDGSEEALHAWDATMHFIGNQYVEVDGDKGYVESWVRRLSQGGGRQPTSTPGVGTALPGRSRTSRRRLEDPPPSHREAVAHRPLPAPLRRPGAVSQYGAQVLELLRCRIPNKFSVPSLHLTESAGDTSSRETARTATWSVS